MFIFIQVIDIFIFILHFLFLFHVLLLPDTLQFLKVRSLSCIRHSQPTIISSQPCFAHHQPTSVCIKQSFILGIFSCHKTLFSYNLQTVIYTLADVTVFPNLSRIIRNFKLIYNRNLAILFNLYVAQNFYITIQFLISTICFMRDSVSINTIFWYPTSGNV
jgi:hypothetical protein